jgi:hypothetical protein
MLRARTDPPCAFIASTTSDSPSPNPVRFVACWTNGVNSVDLVVRDSAALIFDLDQHFVTTLAAADDDTPPGSRELDGVLDDIHERRGE